MTKREAYLSFKCWHCVFLETESGECLCGDPESDECPKPEYDGMAEVRNEIEKWQANKMNELKPCPFCGNEKLVILEESTDSEIYENIINYAVCCDFHRGGCGATSGYRISEEEAIEAWNKRVGEQE